MCLDCLLSSCHTYIMKKRHKNKVAMLWPLTASCMEWHFCAICVYYNNIKTKLSKSQWSRSPCCTVLKNMCLQFHHNHTQNDEKILMFLQNLSKTAKNIHMSLNRTLCNYSVMHTVQSTRYCKRIHVQTRCRVVFLHSFISALFLSFFHAQP